MTTPTTTCPTWCTSDHTPTGTHEMYDPHTRWITHPADPTELGRIGIELSDRRHVIYDGGDMTPDQALQLATALRTAAALLDDQAASA